MHIIESVKAPFLFVSTRKQTFNTAFAEPFGHTKLGNLSEPILATSHCFLVFFFKHSGYLIQCDVSDPLAHMSHGAGLTLEAQLLAAASLEAADERRLDLGVRTPQLRGALPDEPRLQKSVT